LGRFAENNSKGCGGVMRVAPVGLFHWSIREHHSARDTFRLGCELAALTHGHPTGQLTAGVLAVLVRELADGASLSEALAVAKPLLREERDHHETLRALELAEELAAGNLPSEKPRSPAWARAGLRKKRWPSRCIARWSPATSATA
jgi:ADP-ribosylglycohydrolase